MTKTVALVQPDDGEFSYSFEVEGYTTAGLPRPGVSGFNEGPEAGDPDAIAHGRRESVTVC